MVTTEYWSTVLGHICCRRRGIPQIQENVTEVSLWENWLNTQVTQCEELSQPSLCREASDNNDQLVFFTLKTT